MSRDPYPESRDPRSGPDDRPRPGGAWGPLRAALRAPFGGPGTPPTRLGARGGGLLVLAVLLLVGAGYGFTARDDFLSDDYGFLVRSMQASQARDLLGGMDLRPPYPGMWVRPMTALTWYANSRFGDFRDPVGYHLVNLLLHALNALLVARLVLALGGSVQGATAGALLFATFPLHPEAVTWLSGRVDVLAATGMLLALWAWVRWCRDGRAVALGLACLGFAWAALSKEMGVTLPGLAFVLGLALRPPRRRLLVGMGCLTVLFALYWWLRWHLLGGLGGYSNPAGEPVAGQVSDPFRVVRFVRTALVLLAAPLARETLPAGLGFLRWLPGAALLAGAVWCAVDPVRRGRLVPVLVLAVVTLISMAPVATWAFLGDGFRHTRFLYVPSAFVFVAVAWLFPFVAGPPAERGAGAAGNGRRPRVHPLFALGLGALVLLQLAGLRHLNKEWHEAGRLAELSLAKLDERAPDDGPPGPLVVTDLPAGHGNAWLWLNGFALAVRYTTRWRGPVLVLEGEEWRAYFEREWKEHHPTFLVWSPEREDWVVPERP